MIRVMLMAFVVLFVAACSDAQVDDERYRLLNQTVFGEMAVANDATQLIDVRTPREYSGGHIGHAVNIDFHASDFKKRLEELDLSQPIYLYCAAGGRSKKASEMLLEMGAMHVYELKGGFNAWNK